MSDVQGYDAAGDATNPDLSPGEQSVEAALVRPFLSRLSPQYAQRPPEGVPVGTGPEPEAAGVRSYAITSGRAQGSVPLEIESMLQLTPEGAMVLHRLQFERASLAALCQAEILSVAELSARLRLPLGVIRVVASDLIVDGLLEAYLPSFGIADDVDLISRLIEGVRAL